MRLGHYRKRHLAHSAKGSEWENHLYVKKMDGNYYYPDGYENGRTISDLKLLEAKKRDTGSDSKTSGSSGASSSSESESEDKPLSAEDIENLAWQVIRGDFGNGQTRKDLLAENYDAIQSRVNELMKAGDYGSTSMSEVSDEMVETGETAMEEATKKVSTTKTTKSTTASKGVDTEQILSVERKKKREGR